MEVRVGRSFETFLSKGILLIPRISQKYVNDRRQIDVLIPLG